MKKGANLEIYFYIFSLFCLSLMFISFSSAAVAVISPLNGTNHSSASMVLFNVTFVNGTDINIPGTSQTQVNASFFRLNGTQRTLITNSSSCAVSSGTTYACWTRFNVSGIDGFYNISATIFNGSTSVNATSNTTKIYFDSTAPQVSASNFSSPAIGINYSGVLHLNISAIDLTIGVSYVFFNITNSSGAQNSTVVALNSAGNVWNASINTSHYPDGLYNITAYVNDTLNNRNNTAVIYSIYFDNTNPSVSVSCNPDPIQKDEVITCSCSVSDSISVSNSINAHPSTAQTGRFTSTCSSTDSAGNFGSSSTEYTVYDIGGGSGGSSGGGSSGGSGFSPPSTSGTTTGGSSAGTGEPDTTVQGSEEGANTGSGSSSQGIGNASKVILIIIAAAAIIAVVVIMMKRKKY